MAEGFTPTPFHTGIIPTFLGHFRWPLGYWEEGHFECPGRSLGSYLFKSPEGNSRSRVLKPWHARLRTLLAEMGWGWGPIWRMPLCILPHWLSSFPLHEQRQNKNKTSQGNKAFLLGYQEVFRLEQNRTPSCGPSLSLRWWGPQAHTGLFEIHV